MRGPAPLVVLADRHQRVARERRVRPERGGGGHGAVPHAAAAEELGHPVPLPVGAGPDERHDVIRVAARVDERPGGRLLRREGGDTAREVPEGGGGERPGGAGVDLDLRLAKHLEAGVLRRGGDAMPPRGQRGQRGGDGGRVEPSDQLVIDVDCDRAVLGQSEPLDCNDLRKMTSALA